MYLPGHIAIPYLSSRYLNTDMRVAITASFFPDLVDKFCYYVLHATPDARVPAHTLAGMVSTLLVVCLVGAMLGNARPFVYSWTLAFGLHLISDLLNGPIPLLWPFISYGFVGRRSIQGNWSHADLFRVALTVIVEVCITLWALVVWRQAPSQCARTRESLRT